MPITHTYVPISDITVPAEWFDSSAGHVNLWSEVDEDIDTPDDAASYVLGIAGAGVISPLILGISPFVVASPGANHIRRAQLRVRAVSDFPLGGTPPTLTVDWQRSNGESILKLGPVNVSQGEFTNLETALVDIDIQPKPFFNGSRFVITAEHFQNPEQHTQITAINLDTEQDVRPVMNVYDSRVPGNHPAVGEPWYADAVNREHLPRSGLTRPAWPHPHEGLLVAAHDVDELHHNALPAEPLPDDLTVEEDL